MGGLSVQVWPPTLPVMDGSFPRFVGRAEASRRRGPVGSCTCSWELGVCVCFVRC
jgi:hypothetical protein